jgi:hypothetical protein
MVRRREGVEHHRQEVYALQTLRASAVAVPFVIFALAIAVLSTLVT